jgi:predicted transcriptional regulator
MSTLTITLPEDRLSRLQELADRFNVKTEDLVRVGIEDFLRQPDEKFQQVADYILKKNSDLYRRLA